MDESVKDGWLNCAALDVIAIHAYGVGDFSTNAIKPYVQRALNAGKKLIFQEWGACYFNTENNNCPTGGVLNTNTRNQNIQNWANGIAAAGVPWMYWQVLPNADPHYSYDFEIGIGDASWGTLQSVSKGASSYTSAFDFSAYLL